MSFFDHLKEAITQKPALNKPNFYKTDSDLNKQLEQLKEFYKIVKGDRRNQVEQDIKMLSYSLA